MSNGETPLERYLKERKVSFSPQELQGPQLPDSLPFEFSEDSFYVNSPTGQAELTGLIEKVSDQGRDSLTVPEQTRLKVFEETFPQVAQHVQQLEQTPEEPGNRVQDFTDLADEMKAKVQELAVEGKLWKEGSPYPTFEAAGELIDQFAMGLGDMLSPTGALAAIAEGDERYPSSVAEKLKGKNAMSELLADNLTKAGFPDPVMPGDKGKHVNQTTGQVSEYTHSTGSAIAHNLVMGGMRLAPELLAGFSDNPYEFTKGLITFPFHQASVILDALDVTAADDEEVEAARDELIQNPIGPVMLALMAYGAYGKGKSTFKTVSKKKLAEGAKETETLRAETETLKKEKGEADALRVKEETEAKAEAEKAKEVVPEEVVKPAEVKPPEPLEAPEGLTEPRPTAFAEKAAEGDLIKSQRLSSEVAHHKQAIELNEQFLKDNEATLTPERVAEAEVYQRRLSDELNVFEQELAAHKKTLKAPEVVEKPEVQKKVPVELPKEEPVVPAGEPKTLGLNKAEIERIRRDYPDMDQLPEGQKKAVLGRLDEAKQQGLDAKAHEIAADVIKTPRPISDVEYAGMTLRATQLADEYAGKIKEASQLIDKGKTEAGAQARLQAESIIRTLDDLTTASDLGGREVARSLQIRQMRINRENYTLASMMQQAKSRKGKPLNEKETANIEDIVKRHEQAEQRYNELNEKYEAEKLDREKLIAEQIRTETLKTEKKQKSSKQSLLQERTDLKKQLAEKGLTVYSGIPVDASYLIGKLAVNYIREGALTLEQVAARVRKDIPEITDKDVYQGLITKDPNFVKKARSETQKRVENLKKEAKLITDIENAEQGIFNPVRERPVQPQEIKDLQGKLRKLRSGLYKSGMEATKLERALKTINDLQDQLTNGIEVLKKEKSVSGPELQDAREKIRNLRQQIRVDTEITNLKKQLETGEFDVAPRVQTERYLPPELEKALIERQMLRKEARGRLEQLEPITAGKVAVEAVNTLRTIKATADFSATLRQGLVLSARRPVSFSKAYGKSFEAFFSELKAEQIDAGLKGAEHHWIRERSGLYLAPLEKGAKLSLREETFMANWYNRMPIVKQTVGKVFRASERHMVSHLNLMRATAFDQFYRKYPNATRTELEAWANWVNVASGRGKLGSARIHANKLAAVMFAPRFTVSRLQAPAKIIQHWRLPRVRKEIAKDMAALGGLAITTLGLAEMAGFEVGIDPMDPNFGKIMIGNTRIDMFAGFQQPMRLITSMFADAANKADLTPEWYQDMNDRFEPLEALGRFAQYKLAPAITTPLELYRGKTLVGEETDVSSTMARALVPLVYEDIFDAYKEGGIGRAAVSGGLAFHGVGVNTYIDSFSKTQRKITKALAADNFDDAMQLRNEWNIDNPDNKIGIQWLFNQQSKILAPGLPTVDGLRKEILEDLTE